MNKILLLGLSILISCASKPQLYPNGKYKEVGEKAAQKDVDSCMKEAEKFLKSSKGKQITKGAGGGAAIGAAMGAVGGLFTGNIGGGLVRGGAVGAAGGGAYGAVKPDQLRKNYTNQCLHERGYQIIGWD
jgi:hypothetical protein